MTERRVLISAVAFDPQSPSGLNRYTNQFLESMAQTSIQWTCYASSQRVKHLFGQEVRVIADEGLAQGNSTANLRRLVWYQTRLRALLREVRPALFYSPVAEGMIAPPCPQVITIHDVIPLRYPEIHSRLKYYFRYVLPRIIDASQSIVFNSEATKADVQQYYTCENKPIHVVYPTYNEDVFCRVESWRVEAARIRYGLSDYVLSVGETRPYKNIRRLIEAFARLQSTALCLAIVGKINQKDKALESYPRELGVGARVKFLGYVPDEDLAALYNGAHAFVFPSLYEGFGLPLVEAMACGCPVVASNVASIPEVCGTSAVYVNPTSVESIAAGIQRVASNDSMRSSLRQSGLKRVRRFRPEVAVAEIQMMLEGQIGIAHCQQTSMVPSSSYNQ